jgi:hypothetical protein
MPSAGGALLHTLNNCKNHIKMKQKILTGMLLLLSITQIFAASKDNIGNKCIIDNKGSIPFNDSIDKKDSIDKYIVHTFRAAFTEAEEVSWERVNGLAKASFNLNGQHLFAYYSDDARMVALGRDITLGQLPVPVAIALSHQLRRRKYEKYFVSCLFEIVSDDVPSYFIVLCRPDSGSIWKSGDADQRLILKASSAGDLSAYGTIIPPP